jgi:ArsR family transcriptional regulator
MRDTVKAFKSLSDETRLRVLGLVLQQECCVCEVMQALEISQSKASRHLSALYDAGFFKLRKDGLWSLYSLGSEAMPSYLRDVVAALEKSLAANPTVRQDRERLTKAMRIGPRCVGRKSPCSSSRAATTNMVRAIQE